MAEKKDKFGKLCKERMVDELVLRFKERPNFIVTSYMGTTVSGMESLRRNLKKASSEYVVVKNSILRIVFDKLKFKEESSNIDSGMGISFSGDDIISTCKALVIFAKDHDKFKIKGAVIDGKTVSSDRIKSIASLPAKNILIAYVLGGIKSPITGFVNTLGGVLRKFVYCIDAIKTCKEKEKKDGN